MCKAVKNLTNGEDVITSLDAFTLSTAGMRVSDVYEIVIKDGEAEISYYIINYEDGEKRRELYKRAVCTEEEVINQLNLCKLLSWDGFAGAHPVGVLDGTMFALSASVNGGKAIKASGSENFPDHYSDLTDWLYDTLSGSSQN